LARCLRHRFYPPDITQNQEMSETERARWFVTGQAVKLASASQALSKSDNPQYQDAQKKRVAEAEAVLSKLSLPEAKALLAAPTEEAARKLIQAIAQADLSAEIGPLLPEKGSYK